jgi:hypothetical protein
MLQFFPSSTMNIEEQIICLLHSPKIFEGGWLLKYFNWSLVSLVFKKPIKTLLNKYLMK